MSNPAPTVPSKPVFASKTNIVQAVVALAAFYPPARDLVAAHPTEVLVGLSIVNILLRLATKGRVHLFSE